MPFGTGVRLRNKTVVQEAVMKNAMVSDSGAGNLSGVVLAADGTFDKTLHVSGTPTLSVSTGSGYIHVTPGSDNEIHIIGHVHANRWGGMDFGSPEDRVKEVVANPPIEQSGNVVTVGKHTSYHNVSIDYEVTTPKGTNLEANSARVICASPIWRFAQGRHRFGIDRSKRVERAGSLETGSGDIRAEMHSPRT